MSPARVSLAVTLVTRLYFLKTKPWMMYPPGAPLLSYDPQDVGLASYNRPICGGPLPTFTLPHPFDIHEFASNQALCATQLAGGKPFANAGAYCHKIPSAGPSSDGGDMPRVISFADDQTPRLDWT